LKFRDPNQTHYLERWTFKITKKLQLLSLPRDSRNLKHSESFKNVIHALTFSCIINDELTNNLKSWRFFLVKIGSKYCLILSVKKLKLYAHARHANTVHSHAVHAHAERVHVMHAKIILTKPAHHAPEFLCVA
jgi:hypothetical protein